MLIAADPAEVLNLTTTTLKKLRITAGSRKVRALDLNAPPKVLVGLTNLYEWITLSSSLGAACNRFKDEQLSYLRKNKLHIVTLPRLLSALNIPSKNRFRRKITSEEILKYLTAIGLGEVLHMELVETLYSNLVQRKYCIAVRLKDIPTTVEIVMPDSMEEDAEELFKEKTEDWDPYLVDMIKKQSCAVNKLMTESTRFGGYTEALVKNYSSIADNRVFTPVSTLKSNVRSKVFPIQVDLQSSQLRLAALLLREEGKKRGISSPWAEKVLSSDDVYTTLFPTVSRDKAKKKALQTMFNGRKGEYSNDPVFQSLFRENNPKFRLWRNSYDKECSRLKAFKLYIREKLVKKETSIIYNFLSNLSKLEGFEGSAITMHDGVEITKTFYDRHRHVIGQLAKHEEVTHNVRFVIDGEEESVYIPTITPGHRLYGDF